MPVFLQTESEREENRLKKAGNKVQSSKPISRDARFRPTRGRSRARVGPSPH